MADSEALRARRSRAHKAGDHSLCRRCTAAREGGDSPRMVTIAPPPPADEPFDPASEMRRLAVRLAAAHEADPANALLARELRMTLAELMPKGKPQDADLTGLFAALQA